MRDVSSWLRLIPLLLLAVVLQPFLVLAGLVHAAGHWAAARGLGLPVWVDLGLGWRAIVRGSPDEGGVRLGVLPVPHVTPLEGALDRLSTARRAAYLSAGSAANLLVGLGLPTLIFAIAAATTGATGMEPSACVGVDDPASEAARTGIATGDCVVAVDGVAVGSRAELLSALAPGVRDLTVRAVGGDVRAVTLSVDDDPGQWLAGLEVFVGSVAPGSPAEASGLRAGDRIVAIDGEPVRSWADLLAAVRRSMHEGEVRPVALSIRRGGATFEVSVLPEIVTDPQGARPLLGIIQSPHAHAPLATEGTGAFEALGRGVAETAAAVGGLGDVLVALVQGSAPSTLGGPIAIVETPGRAQVWWARALGVVLLSTNLLLVLYNALPLPWSDTWTALDRLVERRWGRRLPTRGCAVALIVVAGLALLLVVVRDVLRVLAS